MSEDEMRNLVLIEAKRHIEIARLDADALDAPEHMRLASALLWLLVSKPGHR